MIEPQGPLPPEIYWRRRVVAGGGVLAIVAVVVALIIWTTSGGDDPQNTANSGTISSPTSASSSTSTPASAGLSESAAPDGGAAGGSGGGTGGALDASASASATPEATGPADPAAAPGNAAPGVPLCGDQSISVVLYTDKPTYTLGQNPVFTIVTTNAGLSECTRDVGKSAQNVVVRTLDGTRTLWTARDCSPINTPNNVVLKPAQQVKDTITWSGTTSSPGCERPRVQIPVGSYAAIGKIGERESLPITFNFVAPAQQP